MKKNHVRIFSSKCDGSKQKLLVDTEFAPTEDDLVGRVLAEGIPNAAYDPETESVVIPKEALESLLEPEQENA